MLFHFLHLEEIVGKGKFQLSSSREYLLVYFSMEGTSSNEEAVAIVVSMPTESPMDGLAGEKQMGIWIQFPPLEEFGFHSYVLQVYGRKLV